MASDDPLDDLYADDTPYDRERLVDTVGEFVQVDPDTGEPVQMAAFSDLDPKSQAVALLLYRQVAVELGEISDDDVAVDALWVDKHSDGEEFEIIDHLYDFEFTTDSDGTMGFYVPRNRIVTALDYLERRA